MAAMPEPNFDDLHVRICVLALHLTKCNDDSDALSDQEPLDEDARKILADLDTDYNRTKRELFAACRALPTSERQDTEWGMYQAWRRAVRHKSATNRTPQDSERK